MTVDEVAHLINYGSWANARMLVVAAGLTQDEFENRIVSSFSSISATLSHIAGAEQYWLHRWAGANKAFALTSSTKPTVTQLTALFAIIESKRTSFLSSLTDMDLNRVVLYNDAEGDFKLPLGQSMCHMVNHSTYHRGQVATQLRQLGRTPPNTDFTRYLREMESNGKSSMGIV